MVKREHCPAATRLVCSWTFPHNRAFHDISKTRLLGTNSGPIQYNRPRRITIARRCKQMPHSLSNQFPPGRKSSGRMNMQTLLVFLKYPEPGKVKTRLAAVVGAEKAANLYRQWI